MKKLTLVLVCLCCLSGCRRAETDPWAQRSQYRTNVPPSEQVVSIEHGEKWSGVRTANGKLHIRAVVTNTRTRENAEPSPERDK